MEVYTDKDVITFNDNFKDILKTVKIVQHDKFDPPQSEIDSIVKFVESFIIKHKRKPYGGHALNQILINKNKDDAIYNEIEMPDIDFYSPDPIVDMILLCNELFDKGYKDVVGKEGQHSSTYKIFVNRHNYVDITYVPTNIFNTIPYIEIDNVNYTHPHFMLIDFYRIAVEPYTNYWRMEKMVPRINKILKHYPILHIEKPIPLSSFGNNENVLDVNMCLSMIHSFLVNNKSTIVTGFYAYNVFLKESNMAESNKNYKLFNIPYFEIITSNYVDDVKDLVKKIKEKYDKMDEIRVIEYYPYFQFYDYNVKIYYKSTLICWIFDIGKKCWPIKKVTPMLLQNNKEVQNNEKNDMIQIGSLSLVIMMSLIISMYFKTNKEKELMNVYKIFTSHLYNIRKYYFKVSKKTMIDDSLFQEFVLDCIGPIINPQKEYFEMIEKKKQEKSGPYIYKYDPLSKRKEAETNYKFLNVSGNSIRNVKNLRINL